MEDLKGQLISIGILIGLLFLVGGWAAASQGASIICETVCSFLPIFKPIIAQAFKDYLTSAKFIVALIIFILSSLGIVVTAKFKRWLLMAVSIILDVISLISLISNLAMCS